MKKTISNASKPPVASSKSVPAAAHHHPTVVDGLKSRKASILTVASAADEHKHTEINEHQVPEEELNTTIDRLLEALDPNAPENICTFSYKEETYKFLPTVEQTYFHFSTNGIMVNLNSEEARFQREELEKRSISVGTTTSTSTTAEASRAEAAEDTEIAEDAEEGEENTKSSSSQAQPSGGSETKNQFNYSARGTQIFYNQIKEIVIQTEPPPSMEFSATATAWEIADSYQEFADKQKRQQLAQQQASQQPAAAPTGKVLKKGKTSFGAQEEGSIKSGGSEAILQSKELLQTLTLMERMVNQNEYEEVISDFKFWDDDSDAFRDSGSLLPLWDFVVPQEVETKLTASNSVTSKPSTPSSAPPVKKKKKQVTCLCWNHKYSDLFAVGYGSYDFKKQGGNGYVCCFSLKNPSYPQYMFACESNVMCLDFHPKHPSLLAIGLYDGTVLIQDVRQQKPIIQSTVKSNKHSDCVWQICWNNNTSADSMNFYSVSSDGRVSNWSLAKNELVCTDIMVLKLEEPMQAVAPPQTDKLTNQSSTDYLVGIASGTCFDFNKKKDHLFVVGTEEGKIYCCSKAYSSQYLHTYEGHAMAVYSVKWNYYNHDQFLSASADWTVKLWDMHSPKALMLFDLGSSVGDVAWAPYSASCFAAVTDTGKVVVFDLKINKQDALCDQLVVKKAKLTHIQFNQTEPVIVVGDDKGFTLTLKLSPNLRKTAVTAAVAATPTTAVSAPAADAKPAPQ